VQVFASSALEAMSFNCNMLASDIDSHIAVGLEQDDYFKAQTQKNLHLGGVSKRSEKHMAECIYNAIRRLGLF